MGAVHRRGRSLRETPVRPAARRRASVVLVTLGLLGSGLVHGSPAEAAPSVTVGAIAPKTVAPGKKATVKPRVVARGKVKVRSVRMSVRRSSSWVARNRKSVRLPAGTYRVATTVKYRARSAGGWGRVRTASRTQTLQVRSRQAPATAARPTTPVPSAPAPGTAVPTPAPPPESSAGVTGAPCDLESLRKDDGTAWTCTFSDEFTGTTLDRSKWIPQQTATSGYRNGDECYVDSADNISVEDGALRLTVREEPEPFLCVDPFGNRTTSVTSGMVSTWHSFAQAYGRFEIRAAFPASKKAGLHAALWLWPQDAGKYGGWPLSGEIDIAEMYSQWSDRVIPYIHYLLGTVDESVTNNYCMIDDVSDFHTYTLEWTSTTLTIAYDGQVCVSHRIRPQDTQSGSGPFDQPFMIALTQGLGIGTNAATPATELPATTAIDYVRVWK